MLEDLKKGWWEAPAGTHWVCPECKEKSPIEKWEGREPGCEDCGNHDGRECPKCGEIFDHVWGESEIERATLKLLDEEV